MSMTVQRRKDSRTPRVLMHKIADIRGGVAVATSELGGDYLREGAVLSAPVDGISHVVKVAVVAAAVAAADTTIKVEKYHNLKVGDFILIKEKSAAVAITAIDETDKTSDTLTVGAALGKIDKGVAIAEAKAESSTASALKYVPFAVNGTGKPVLPKQNLDTDAWVIAVTKGNVLPDCVKSYLTTIVNY